MTNGEEMALQQFTGYAHAKQGGTVEQLILSMGLTKDEFANIRKYIKGVLSQSPSDFEDAVEYMQKEAK
jgi:hypothetical protein